MKFLFSVTVAALLTAGLNLNPSPASAQDAGKPTTLPAEIDLGVACTPLLASCEERAKKAEKALEQCVADRDAALEDAKKAKEALAACEKKVAVAHRPLDYVCADGAKAKKGKCTPCPEDTVELRVVDYSGKRMQMKQVCMPGAEWVATVKDLKERMKTAEDKIAALQGRDATLRIQLTKIIEQYNTLLGDLQSGQVALKSRLATVETNLAGLESRLYAYLDDVSKGWTRMDAIAGGMLGFRGPAGFYGGGMLGVQFLRRFESAPVGVYASAFGAMGKDTSFNEGAYVGFQSVGVFFPLNSDDTLRLGVGPAVLEAAKWSNAKNATFIGSGYGGQVQFTWQFSKNVGITLPAVLMGGRSNWLDTFIAPNGVEQSLLRRDWGFVWMVAPGLTFGGNFSRPPAPQLQNEHMIPQRQPSFGGDPPDPKQFNQPVPPKGAAPVPPPPVDEDSDDVEPVPERPQVAPPAAAPPAPSALPPLPPKQPQPVVPRRGIRPGALAPVEQVYPGGRDL